MVAPYADIYERDNSNYVSSEQSVNTFIASWAPCGPIGTREVVNKKTFYNNYSTDGKYKAGYPTAFLNAEAVFDMNSPINFCRVVPEDALYGGAVVTVGSAKPSYSLQQGIASPESFVFAEVKENLTNEQVSILCKKNTNGSLGETYFYLPNKEQFVYFRNKARAEVATITCSADTTGSLNNTYVILPGDKYYAWFNVDSTGVDPGESALTLIGMTGVEVAIAANLEASKVATALAGVFNNHTDLFTAEASDAVVTVTMKTAGTTTHGNAGTSGFNYITTVQGLDASKQVEISDLTGIPVSIEGDATDTAVASAINTAMANNKAFSCAIDNVNNNIVTITAKTAGFMTDAQDGENPTTFVITTVVQGSSESGAESMLFYSADPNALNLSIRIYSNQDNPTKAPEPNTFVVAVYKDNVLETEITCSRKQDLKDGTGAPLYVEQAMLQSNYVRCRNNEAVSDDEMPVSFKTTLKISGGSPGSNVTTGDMINAVDAWSNKDDFNVTLMLVGGYTDPAYVAKLNSIASTRGDCCVVNSIPYYVENTADYLNSIVNYRKNQLNINSSYTATFTSNLEVYNADLNKNVYIPSDGHIAGAIINASRNYEIFYPVLGFKRGILNNVLDVKHRYSREEMNALYANQLNPIRYVPGRGIVIWGQKTMQSQASSLDRLNARLLLCSIKPRLQQFLEDTIGELNDDQTRDAITILLNGVFDQLVAKRGITAYEVTCDPVDANDPNKLSIQVRLQITPAIEYVELTITLTPSGVEFS